MSRSYRPMLFLLMSVLLSTFVACQEDGGGDGGGDSDQAAPPPEMEKDPNAVKSNDKSKGVVGRFQEMINPGTQNLYEFINAALIRIKHKQLPCTIYSVVPWDAICTDLPASE